MNDNSEASALVAAIRAGDVARPALLSRRTSVRFSAALGTVLTERIRWSVAFKTVVFMPMAISLVGAATIWRFVYYAAPAGHARHCPADGSEHFPRIDPAVIMLVTDDASTCGNGQRERAMAEGHQPGLDVADRTGGGAARGA